MNTTTDRQARMTLAALCEPGNAELADLLAAHDAATVLEELCGGAGQSRLARTVVNRLAGRDPAALTAQLSTMSKHCGSRIVVPTDPEWPTAVNDLNTLHDEAEPDNRAPICLWVRGAESLAAACERAVSIVGARSCSAYGKHIATELGYHLGVNGWTTISGGAYGIDAAVHRGSLAANATTVAVMACGVDRPYPAAHATLFDGIVGSGLMVSEWPIGDIPQRHRFLIRNRVIAAMTRGTVVVEAAARSGARHTARRARELERPLMVVPGPVTSATSQGTHQLAREPGEARIVTCAADIIEDLGHIGEGLQPQESPSRHPRDDLPVMAARVWDAMSPHQYTSIRHICAQASVPLDEGYRTLELLLQRGLACRDGAGYRAKLDG